MARLAAIACLCVMALVLCAHAVEVSSTDVALASEKNGIESVVMSDMELGRELLKKKRKSKKKKRKNKKDDDKPPVSACNGGQAIANINNGRTGDGGDGGNGGGGGGGGDASADPSNEILCAGGNINYIRRENNSQQNVDFQVFPDGFFDRD